MPRPCGTHALGKEAKDVQGEDGRTLSGERLERSGREQRGTGRHGKDWKKLRTLLSDIQLFENHGRQSHVLHQHSQANTIKTTLGCSRINETYCGCWIGRGEFISWPPRSPDLTLLDYCAWSCLKSEVYKCKVATREELLARILYACAQVKECRNQLRSAAQQLYTRAAKCTEVGGGLYEHVL
ncbi:hypothetical protein ANN_03284 [Periplaneta americana]|uniref:Uncharacterized protein n=1 Tax=Periplaneta americana TaxID=6978 RepID=A0ABQ8TYQ0_PERAM|nr:hypothetical protein ANN_03284 [Periplaneta americana]